MTSTAMTSTETPAAEPYPPLRRSVDVWLCLAVGLGGIFWASVAKPLSDPDIWWHVRTGQLILDKGVPHTEPWAFTALGRTWVPTAWLSDVGLALLHDAFGWLGIIGFKVVAAAILLVTLARLLFRTASGPVALLLFLLATLTVSPFLSERPQLISLILTVWLARQAQKSLAGDHVSWSALPLSYLWANLHGMWVLVPVAMGVLVVGLLLDRTAQWRSRAARAGLVGGGSVALAALTPVGPRLAYWSLVVRDTAKDISEWQPTTLADKYGLVYLAVFLLWVMAVARSSRRVPQAEVVWMCAMLLLGLQAGRNIAPTVILMAPIAAQALTQAYGVELARLPRLRAPLAVPIVLILGAASLATAVHVQRGTVVDGLPYRIVDELEKRPGTVRVLNDYNVGGFLTGEGAPKISVAIDGRTDNYDADFVHRYLRATKDLVDWRDVVRHLDPDVAVTAAHGPLARELEDDGWSVVLKDDGFLLMEAPRGD